QTENSGYNEYDLVVMKLNRDGTITGIDKPGEAPVNVTVYPNPGESTVSVCGKVAGCLFSMYDNTGRLILQKKLTANNEMLDTADWPAGFYTYRVTGSGSFVAAGKWIKL
ncbi:MAG TPA: T9SS type A sorting domain-containing protein, partial [Bacteroidales bacterium]|nr:T9SS type A sorting domain-containing protein [Bacteroidales bacterium]HPT02356.1 T9SS type A sorting domain-containing protein [Bacteroidales bacterium]